MSMILECEIRSNTLHQVNQHLHVLVISLEVPQNALFKLTSLGIRQRATRKKNMGKLDSEWIQIVVNCCYKLND